MLAAGSSARMGQPKQLLKYNGTTLLHHVLQVAIDSPCKPFVTVLGANASLFKEEVEAKGVQAVINKNWTEGMASSVHCGLTGLLKIHPAIDAVMFIILDQPFISSTLLNELINKRMESHKRIIACEYGDTVGTPVLFDKSFFPELLGLKGSEGAKSIVKKNMESTATVSFPMGYIDIDTPEDYDRLLKNQFTLNGGKKELKAYNKGTK